MALGNWQTLYGRKSVKKSSQMLLMQHLVCLIRASAGTPGGFSEAGANDLQSLEDLLLWQPTMLLSIRELISIPSLVYLSLISAFSFLPECGLAVCQPALQSISRTKEEV